MNLTKLFAASLVAAGFLLISHQTAEAQIDGYRFGIGNRYANGAFQGQRFGFGLGLVDRSAFQRNLEFTRNPIPHFAQYPPVYYSNDIVRRPYGVSPFAAPPGIVPVEMQVQQTPKPAVIKNHFVDPIHEEIIEEEIIDEEILSPSDIKTEDLEPTPAKKPAAENSAPPAIPNSGKQAVIMNPFVGPRVANK